MALAIIGGTGVYDPDLLSRPREEKVETPYGSVLLLRGEYGDREVVFLNRHGGGHALPPHRVNYRANIWALREAGVRRVIATAAVGSLSLAYAPGHMAFLDQFIDFTKQRPTTFFDDRVVHTDFSQPYCPNLRATLYGIAKEYGITAHSKGCYVATEGPRFETPAEIRAYRLLGGDVVGMTGVPEVVLARELGLCYGTVALVTNYAAGISAGTLSHDEVLAAMERQSGDLRRLLAKALETLDEECPVCQAGGTEQ